MKRSDELASLSREHYAALAVALHLRRATPEDAERARAAFGQFFETEGRAHFRAEEELLLPAFARYAPCDDPDIVPVLVEHVDIRRRAHDVATADLVVEDLHELGSLLEAHVRHEERT